MNDANGEKLADFLVQTLYSSLDLQSLEELAEIGTKFESESSDLKVKLLNAAIRREIERRKTEAHQ
jgi:hypothetical protein